MAGSKLVIEVTRQGLLARPARSGANLDCLFGRSTRVVRNRTSRGNDANAAPPPAANGAEGRAGRCAYRKSNPDIFVMQSAEDRAAKNTPCPLYDAR
jgi:hypothetical protein